MSKPKNSSSFDYHLISLFLFLFLFVFLIIVKFSKFPLFEEIAHSENEKVKERTEGINSQVKSKPLFLIAGGDIIFQKQLIEIANYRAKEKGLASAWKLFFHALEPIFQNYQKEGSKIVVANLESPVATQRVEPKSYPPTFNGPPEALEGLKEAGFDILTIANNHTLDQGRKGLSETIDALQNAGLKYVGGGRKRDEAEKPLIIKDEVSEIRIAIFSFLFSPKSRTEPENMPAISIFREGATGKLNEIKKRGEAEVIVVFMHWIGEFIEKPMKKWKDAVEELIGAGADAVICHGPHVVGPAGWVEVNGRRGFVAYSLGNLLANFGWEVYPSNFLKLFPDKNSAQRINARSEALCVLRIEREKEKTGGAVLKEVILYPLWLEDNRYASLRKNGPPREIYPIWILECMPPPEFGCPKNSKPQECSARWEMIYSSTKAIVEKLWNFKGWQIKKCPSLMPSESLSPLAFKF